jgi:hypothetical protein
MKRLIAFATALFLPALIFAQTVVIVLCLVIAAGCGGMLIWVLDKNASSINMHWVVLERCNGHGTWAAIQTNRVPVAPKKLEAFPAFFLVSATNNVKLYRVRLAEDWEIPQGFVPSIRPGAEAQPVLYDTNKLNELMKP